MEAVTTGKPNRLSKSESNQPSRKLAVILNYILSQKFLNKGDYFSQLCASI